ncbi:MAG: hypothetical protein ISR83_05780 [Candidatus Marinimicrobia bacterium]|nr:hypothetical protein [Candidatus Neomarinimicrobiota bacterium]
MSEKLDKIISSIFIMGSLTLVAWWVYSAFVGGVFSAWMLQSSSSSQTWVETLKSNWGMIIPIYLFICFQAAGISEIRKGQDYLHAVIISIFFTPLSLFFMSGEDDE